MYVDMYIQSFCYFHVPLVGTNLLFMLTKRCKKLLFNLYLLSCFTLQKKNKLMCVEILSFLLSFVIKQEMLDYL